jgi:hypothetical protein
MQAQLTSPAAPSLRTTEDGWNGPRLLFANNNNNSNKKENTSYFRPPPSVGGAAMALLILLRSEFLIPVCALPSIASVNSGKVDF